MSTVLDYGFTNDITVDAEVIAKQIWKGAPKAKREDPASRVDLTKAITSISTEDTIDGSSTLTVALLDHEWRLLDSGFFDPNKNGKLDPIEVNYPDGSRFLPAPSQRRSRQ